MKTEYKTVQANSESSWQAIHNTHNSDSSRLFQVSSLLAGELPNDAAANLPFGSPDVVEMSSRRVLHRVAVFDSLLLHDIQRSQMY